MNFQVLVLKSDIYKVLFIHDLRFAVALRNDLLSFFEITDFDA
jgi:hypothetical protein